MARRHVIIDGPQLFRLRQFRSDVTALRKQANGVSLEQRLIPRQQLLQWGKRLRRDNIDLSDQLRHDDLKTLRMDRGRRTGEAGDVAQEGAFACIALDRSHPEPGLCPEDFQTSPGKPAPEPKLSHAFASGASLASCRESAM